MCADDPSSSESEDSSPDTRRGGGSLSPGAIVRVGGGGGLKATCSPFSGAECDLKAESFADAANRPHEDDAGRVAIGGGGADVLDTGLGEMECSSALRFGFDRLLGKGGGALMSELVVTALWGLLANAGDNIEDGRGGGGGGGLPIDADAERLFNE